MKPENKRNLRQKLDRLFSLSELRLFASDLGVDWDHLAGEEKRLKVLSLIEYMENRQRLNEVVDALKRERPDPPIQKPSSVAQPKPIPDLSGEYHSCFISFSSKDQVFAEKLNKSLKENGVQTWFAPHDLKIGARMRQTFDQNVQMKHKLLLILSESSVSSDWVEQEVETALAKERKEKITMLFPVRIDAKVFDETVGWPALITNTRNIGDFSNWVDEGAYQVALQRLLRDLHI